MKTKFKELLDTPLKHGGFTIASQTLSIGEKAERIAKQAKDAQDDNGEHAKMFASNIQDWMQQISDQAQESLDFQMKGRV
jgi:ferritin-like protein